VNGQTPILRTYEMATDPPPPMAWTEYEQIAKAELSEALNSEASESTMHALFERHPCLVPARHGLPITAADAPFPAALISKPPLPSFAGPIPDFMWITSDSVTLNPVLIEIEAPTKPWFTKSGQQTAELTQARDQLLQWRIWFQTSHNREAFLDFYRLDGMLRYRSFKPMFLLIYGRRTDSHRTELLAHKRGLMQEDGTNVVSYDRLIPSQEASEYMCARVNKDGYKSVSLAPTMTLGPLFAVRRSYVSGKEAAALENAYLTAQRKEFLSARFAYWDDWAAIDNKGSCSLGDAE
jgi:Shedu protein SduA, C-terminal